MIRRCIDEDFESIYLIVNDAAGIYKGVIPSDCWSEPYMPRDELRAELDAGVVFLCREHEGEVAGVMGIQAVADVTLIRHAYVRPSMQNPGDRRRVAFRPSGTIPRPTPDRHLGCRYLGHPLL